MMQVRKNMRTRARARINNRSAGSVLRMHTFKRFAHHSLSRASVDVQSVTSLAAEETPVPKSASRNCAAAGDGGRRWRLRRHVDAANSPGIKTASRKCSSSWVVSDSAPSPDDADDPSESPLARLLLPNWGAPAG